MTSSAQGSTRAVAQHNHFFFDKYIDKFNSNAKISADIHPPPSDKKSQTWSETLEILIHVAMDLGSIWNGLGSIWKAVGSSWNGLGFNWNGLGSNVKALNQERASIQKCVYWTVFLLFHKNLTISTTYSQYPIKLGWRGVNWNGLGVQRLFSVSFSGLFLFYNS